MMEKIRVNLSEPFKRERIASAAAAAAAVVTFFH